MRKLSQIYLKVAVIGFILALGIKFYYHNKTLLWVWIIALAAGFVLHRSGICFSGAFTDMILFKDYTMARAMLLITIVSMTGISIIQFISLSNGKMIPGNFAYVGINTLIGAFLFGMGMVFAGACGCGTLQRIGEGFMVYVFVLVSIMIGSVLGAYHFSWWTGSFAKVRPVFLADVFGWPGGFLVSLAVLGVLYMLTFRVEKGPYILQRGWGKWHKKG